MVTEDQILKWSGNKIAAFDVTKWFNEFSDKYEVNTPLRTCAFFAQVIHESGGFKYTKEIASGKQYEGRKDLGNTNVGDGVKFKGRGYIQLTGRNNYKWMGNSIFGDSAKLLNNPELLEQPEYAMQSAFIYWDSRNLNNWADMEDFSMITRKINGGLTHFAERVKIYNKIRLDLNLPLYSTAA